MPTDQIPRILIIDDELFICQNCIRILSKLICEAEYALTGLDGLKMMDENPFDVVVTDLKMGALGGMEVLRRIKEAHPETMVIVMTGYASISSAVEVMKMGRLTTFQNRLRHRNCVPLCFRPLSKEPCGCKIVI